MGVNEPNYASQTIRICAVCRAACREVLAIRTKQWLPYFRDSIAYNETIVT